MTVPSAVRRALVTLAVATAAAGALVLVVELSARPQEGPAEVVWDGTRCARCQMLVSEPGFAAQIHTTDGRVLHFDDPGCLLLYRAEHEPAVHAVYFHHLREPRWLPAERTVFVTLADTPTPMGYGLGALTAGAAEGLSRSEALARVRAVEARRGAAGGRP